MKKSTLLLVDDRPHMLDYRKQSLEPFGYSVVVANSAPAALSALEKTPVSAVLVEYKSEEIDVEAVAFLVKQRYSAQPVVLLSADSAMPEPILWLVDEYVMCSEPPEVLVEAIQRATRPKEFGKANKTDSCRTSSTLPGQAIA